MIGCSKRFSRSDSRRFLLGAHGAFGVHRRVGVKHPLSQIDEGVVPVADRQPLGLEQDAGLPVVRHAQRPVRPHQRLEELPLTVSHPRLMPLKGLQTCEEVDQRRNRKQTAQTEMLPLASRGRPGTVCSKWCLV